ncbi:MAG TPA: hypothetical protein DCY79_10005 [Planctomycetaceae bacterium]|nr:hypothetical protein [Blastopirellula sp.]HAY80124.1 hypothetical protein [Planctomycetaceae bacterium]
MSPLKAARFLLVILVASSPLVASAYKPDDKVVKDLVANGVTFLSGDLHYKYHLGEECLVAYTLYKAGKRNDPKIAAALQKCAEGVRNGKVSDSTRHFTYNVSVATIFISEASPKEHRAILETYTKALLNSQVKGGQSDGAWTYGGAGDGDTSQTQYAMLALWSAHAAGVEIPIDQIDRAMKWLMRVQDPSGGWRYTPAQGERFKLTRTMATGAVGSLLMGADIGKIQLYEKKERKGKDDTPGIVKKKKKPDAPQARAATLSSVDINALRTSIGRGNSWMQNNWAITTPNHNNYYLYSMERYFSFREQAEHNKQENPGWYNQGVDYLRKTMKRAEKGGGYWSWGAQDSIRAETEPVDTAFALLFLLRASGERIQEALGEGLLKGGHGLPDDLTSLTQDADGTIKKPQMEADLDEVLKGLESSASFDNLPKVPKLSDKGGEREQQIAQLKKMISGENFEARRFAVRALGRARNLDNIPPLIYALTDPDQRIVREARDGLRFISRKFRGFRIPDEPTPVQVNKGISDWKNWYTTIRPDADVDYLP